MGWTTDGSLQRCSHTVIAGSVKNCDFLYESLDMLCETYMYVFGPPATISNLGWDIDRTSTAYHIQSSNIYIKQLKAL